MTDLLGFQIIQPVCRGDLKFSLSVKMSLNLQKHVQQAYEM